MMINLLDLHVHVADVTCACTKFEFFVRVFVHVDLYFLCSTVRFVKEAWDPYVL